MKKFILLLLALCPLLAVAQPVKDYAKMSRREIMAMSYEELLALPLEDVMAIAEALNVSIEELYEILNPNVSIASKTAERLFASPLSTSVVTSKEIRQSGATSIEEALRLLSGLIVRQKNGGNYDVHLRGNDNIPPGNMLLYAENSTTLVMIDGRAVYNYAHGGTFWETFPIDINDVEQIEVIRGAASALYGPNAASGVINIITKRPTEKGLDLQVNAQGGTNETYMAHTALNVGINDKLAFRLSGNYNHFNRFQDDFYAWSDSAWHEREELPLLVDDQGTPLEDDPEGKFPDPYLGRENYGGNLSMYYDLTDSITTRLSYGYQQSDVITTPLNNPWISFDGRTSKTHSIDWKTKVYGANLQLSYHSGEQDVSKATTAYMFDLNTFDALLDYDFRWKNLSIRPGLNYRKSTYDDESFIDASIKEGFLNGARSVEAFAYSLRLDYVLFEKLRLVGAFRGDHYNYPEDPYFTWQFVASYKLNSNNVLRAVYSRANRGPFIVELHSDYDWVRVQPNPMMPTGVHVYFKDNKDLDLVTMDLTELGFRRKWSDVFFTDLELFYFKTKNFNYFFLDSSQVVVLNPADPVNTAVPLNTWYSYHNMDVESHQLGASLSAKIAFTRNLHLKLHGTYQQTELKDYFPFTTTEVMEHYVGTFLMTGTGMIPDSLADVDHEWTPSFYGGGAINYMPIPQVNININAYFYGKQTLIHAYQTIDVDPKFILNMRVAYRFWKQSEVFFNARNLLNDDKPEFAFTDKVKGLYLFGLHLSL